MKPNKAYRKFGQACLDAPPGASLTVGVMWAEGKGWRVMMQVHTSVLHLSADTARGLADIYDKAHRAPEWCGKTSGLEWVAPELRNIAAEVDEKNRAGAVPPEMLDVIAARGRA